MAEKLSATACGAASEGDVKGRDNFGKVCVQRRIRNYDENFRFLMQISKIPLAIYVRRVYHSINSTSRGISSEKL